MQVLTSRLLEATARDAQRNELRPPSARLPHMRPRARLPLMRPWRTCAAAQRCTAMPTAFRCLFARSSPAPQMRSRHRCCLRTTTAASAAAAAAVAAAAHAAADATAAPPLLLRRRRRRRRAHRRCRHPAVTVPSPPASPPAPLRRRCYFASVFACMCVAWRVGTVQCVGMLRAKAGPLTHRVVRGVFGCVGQLP